MMKKLTMLITLIVLIGFSGCEQMNPPANASASGTDVQVTQGDQMGGNENDDDDDEEDDDDD
ncbi:hypothetical protein BFP97_04905 [Roseivirga sp. 4D4]|uniref:hypothetical protein n=1 Tax=Roseivirga sp. 4D4 TaxID=1889784 RepID=UPI000853E2BE|nr:hypothetical protein [Roseivirga sp. 4D4]OEK00888.1 hypothetical protein BFP97_04905 [Roseivirga sp. 4D4]